MKMRLTPWSAPGSGFVTLAGTSTYTATIKQRSGLPDSFHTDEGRDDGDGQTSKSNGRPAHDSAATRRPAQERPRHHAQGQGAQRRPRPPAAPDLGDVPEVPRRRRAAARTEGRPVRQEVPTCDRGA